MPPGPFILEAWRPWLLYLPFALVALAPNLVLLLLLWLALHCLAVFLGRGPKVQATPLQGTSEKCPVALACSSVGSAVSLLVSGVFLFSGVFLLYLSCVFLACVGVWKKGGRRRSNTEPGELRRELPKSSKILPESLQNGSRRLENRSKMAPGGLPGASREPKLIFDAFLASVEQSQTLRLISMPDALV